MDTHQGMDWSEISRRQANRRFLAIPAGIAGRDSGEPDVVRACVGDVPTQKNLAAVQLLRLHVPDLKIRIINVMDLMTLQPREEHPLGISSKEVDVLFTTEKPIIFAYHDYPWLIHRLTRIQGQINTISMCAAIKKKVRRPRRSSWRFATTKRHGRQQAATRQARIALSPRGAGSRLGRSTGRWQGSPGTHIN